jgi:hypothetical protein
VQGDRPLEGDGELVVGNVDGVDDDIHNAEEHATKQGVVATDVGKLLDTPVIDQQVGVQIKFRGLCASPSTCSSFSSAC